MKTIKRAYIHDLLSNIKFLMLRGWGGREEIRHLDD